MDRDCRKLDENPYRDCRKQAAIYNDILAVIKGQAILDTVFQGTGQMFITVIISRKSFRCSAGRYGLRRQQNTCLFMYMDIPEIFVTSRISELSVICRNY